MPFSDVLMTRKLDRCIQRYICEKTFTVHYTNIRGFAHPRQKWNLLKYLVSRNGKICSPETRQDKCNTITNVIRAEGHPLKFIKNNMNNEKAAKSEVFKTKRKGQLINPSFQILQHYDDINLKYHENAFLIPRTHHISCGSIFIQARHQPIQCPSSGSTISHFFNGSSCFVNIRPAIESRGSNWPLFHPYWGLSTEHIHRVETVTLVKSITEANL